MNADRGPIVVPVDEPAACAMLLPFARTLAEIWRAQLLVLSIADPPLAVSALRAALEAPGLALNGLALEQRTGDPGAAILDLVRERAATLVIMLNESRSPAAGAPLSPASEAVLRGGDCPLLFVSRPADASAAAEHASLARVLLPLDGSVEMAAALAALEPLLSRPEAVVDLVHVVPETDGGESDADTFTLPRYLDQIYHEWSAWRQEFADRFQDGVEYEPGRVHVAVGNPGLEIAAAARRHGSDVIALVWKGVLDGGHAPTLQTVLRIAPCPVLVVQIDRQRAARARA